MSTQAFSTLIRPTDRFEDLIRAAEVRICPEPMLEGLDALEPHFRPEPAERTVMVRLWSSPGRFGIGDVEALQRVTEEGMEPLSFHAFLALLAQHPAVESGMPGISVPQSILLNGYACLLRVLRRRSQPRILQLMPVRSRGYLVTFDSNERFAVEAVREDTASARSDDGA